MSEKIAIDFSIYRQLILHLFRIVAFDTRNFRSEENVKQKILIFLKDAIFILSIINNCIFYAIILWKSSSDMATLIIVTNQVTTGLVSILRNVKLFLCKEEIAKVLQLFERKYTKDEEMSFELGKCLRSSKLITSYYVLSYIFILLLMFILPIATTIISGEQTFPSFGLFVSFDSNWTFFLAMFWSAWSFISLMTGIVAANILLAGTLAILSSEFKVLKETLKDLPTMPQNDDQLELMKTFVDMHNELSKNVSILEKIFSFPLFLSFLSCSFNVSFSLFQGVLLSSKTNDSTQMIFFGVITLLQVYIECYFGQMLKSACDNFRVEIYNSGWESVKNAQVKRGLILILRKSQRPALLTLMKFADVSMERFTTVGLSFFLNYKI